MVYLFILVILILFFCYEIWENKNPYLEKMILKDSVSRELRILHISDLHNYNFGKNQKKLKKLIVNNYDFIFITGDLIDRRYPNIESAMELIYFLVEKYPNKVYFSTGNHEKGSEQYNILRDKLISSGTKILENDNVEIENLNLIGLEDPSEYENINTKIKKDYNSIIDKELSKLINKNKYNILLSHRPEYFEIYAKHEVNLVFSGHSHGGQVKIFNRGLYASGQGVLARFTGGIFKNKNTTMINSRGLGNNFPLAFRIFNRPHIIELKLISNL